MQKKSLFFAGIILCLLIMAATAFYWYQKPRESLADVQPAYTLPAKELYAAFEQDEQKANQQFLGKVILVTGIIDNMEETDSTLSILLSTGNDMGGINCSVKKGTGDQLTPPATGMPVKVKGRCIGFLMDVNLVDAIIEQ